MPEIKAYRNIAKNAKVGRDPTEKWVSGFERDESWVAPIGVHGHTLFMGPGDTVFDENGRLKLMLEAENDFFVSCTSKDEADALRVPESKRVYGKTKPYEGKLLGWFGLSYVVREVTDEVGDQVKMTDNRIASIKRLQQLETDLHAANEREAQVTNEAANLRVQLAKLQEQVQAHNSTQAQSQSHDVRRK